MRSFRLLILLAGLAFSACSYPNEFRNSAHGTSHAVLRGAAFHINGQPTSFWRSGDEFRIPPGPTTCNALASGRRETNSYRELKFVAKAGRKYLLRRKLDPNAVSPLSVEAHPSIKDSWIIYDRRDRMTVLETTAASTPRLITDAAKEDYVFGVPSRTAALAEYCRENPLRPTGR